MTGRLLLAVLCAAPLSAMAATDSVRGANAPAAVERGAPASASGARLGEDEAVRALIALTDAAELEAVFSRQFVDRIANAVSLFRPDVDPRTMQVIRQEAGAVLRERIESGDALYAVLAPVYQKHFNIFELNRLVEFYQSPLGQKLVAVSPQLLGETIELGSEWGLSLVPEVMSRVRSRLDEAPAERRR